MLIDFFYGFLVGFVGFLEKVDLDVEHKDRVYGTCSKLIYFIYFLYFLCLNSGLIGIRKKVDTDELFSPITINKKFHKIL